MFLVKGFNFFLKRHKSPYKALQDAFAQFGSILKEIANMREYREDKRMKMLVKALGAQIENEDDVDTSSNDVQIIEEKTNKERKLENIKEAKIKKKKGKIGPSTRREKKMWLKGLEISIEGGCMVEWTTFLVTS